MIPILLAEKAFQFGNLSIEKGRDTRGYLALVSTRDADLIPHALAKI